MKTIKLFTSLCLALAISHVATAQSSVDDMVKDWERAKAYTKEYLDAMPDSGYALKPKPDMRSFAEQMLHITDANFNIVTAITGEKGPEGAGQLEKTTTDKSKANITKLTMAGYDFVINGIKKMTPAQMNERIKLFNTFDLTKGQAFAKDFEHQTHQRGQTTVYLHLAGVKPPQEKLF